MSCISCLCAALTAPPIQGSVPLSNVSLILFSSFDFSTFLFCSYCDCFGVLMFFCFRFFGSEDSPYHFLNFDLILDFS